ncbi:MAG: flagellar biosynthesis protein FlgM [Deltaproteobacteria bacterium]|nr:MAG: flagellar biosynthesis protein FlgM [Deltaproteobacteria bacterium]
MRWRTGRRSSNVEDRRGTSIGGKGKVTGGIGVVILALVGMYFGVDPALIMNSGLLQGDGSQVQKVEKRSDAENQLADFTSVVLADTEDTWSQIFQQAGKSYQPPKLVLFTNQIRSACGFAKSATGPFYCPADRKVYVDLGFYQELRNNLNAPGDFAQAYVIAHEVGHHVQNLLGISPKVQAQRGKISKKQYNALSVKLELQADCFAGIWANHADRVNNIVEPGDVNEALNAASRIGDDTLQKQARGYAVPDSFTHGTSSQRVAWFTKGYKSGNINDCNTFR